MRASPWLSGAGLAGITGGLIAIVFTPAFATAYFLAYPGSDVPPFWLPLLETRLRPVLSFASPDEVYETYGGPTTSRTCCSCPQRSHCIGCIGTHSVG